MMYTYDERNKFLADFINDRIPTDLSGRVEFSFDPLCNDIDLYELWIDNNLFKRFYAEELINYEYPNYLKYSEQTQKRYEEMLATNTSSRDVYTGEEFDEALLKYLSLGKEDVYDSRDPLIVMLALLDKNIDPDGLQASVTKAHGWLEALHKFRRSGKMPEKYYDRDVVVLDFCNCDEDHSPYYVMRREMKWFSYFGDGLDALWDILTGMPYYGDDFIIKRLKKHSYMMWYGEVDYTERVDKICKIFREAAEECGNITVTIEYCD